jgi:hypothetical protein
MMNEHIRIGKQYREITQLLLYSFGLQDQEFVVVYETDDLAALLEAGLRPARHRSPLHEGGHAHPHRRARRRLVFISSTAVYGERDGGTVDEATTPDPANFRGEILLEAERVARRRDGETVIVRPSGIYGPGRDRLLRRAAQGRLEGGDRWTNRIHRDDLAEAIRHALGLATPSPLYLASDLEPARLREVLEWLAAALDVPWESAQAGQDGTPSAPEIPGKRCVPRRLLDEGFAFAFPTWREGYRSVIGSTSRSGTGDQHIPDRPGGFHLDRDDSGRVVLR